MFVCKHEKQQNKLKMYLLFKEKKNFTGIELENSADWEDEIFRVLFLYE